MTRNLKGLGLALVAILAFGAFAAQGASAAVEHSFESEVEETVLTGKTESYSNAEAKSIETLTATAGVTIQCYGTYETTVKDKVVDQVTVHPTYESCRRSGGAFNVVVHTDGCNYIFDSDTTEDANHSAGKEHATVSLECEDEHWIEITTAGCDITFGDNHDGTPVNQSLHGVTYNNVTDSSNHSITVNATVRTIKYEVTPGSFCGLIGHGANTYSNGKLDAKVEVTGYKESGQKEGSTTTGRVWSHGEQIDVTLSGTP